ncbi:hypothetical protein [Lysobacter gummosus]|uniref:hypothetical protein n=1 Tax=Lysobacter gummosus TaxID=262324 RepID=UPI00362C3D92
MVKAAINAGFCIANPVSPIPAPKAPTGRSRRHRGAALGSATCGRTAARPGSAQPPQAPRPPRRSSASSVARKRRHARRIAAAIQPCRRRKRDNASAAGSAFAAISRSAPRTRSSGSPARPIRARS